MEKHIHLFSTQQEFETAYNGDEYIEPWLSYVKETEKVGFNDNTDYTSMPLTFEILSDGIIYWRSQNSAVTRTIQYKKNDGEWVSITSNKGASSPSINVSSGDMLAFRGNNSAYAEMTGSFGSPDGYSTFSGSTCEFNAIGNIMSLISASQFNNITSLTASYTFYSLFRSTKIVSAKKLVLPATTLTNHCYEYLFYFCKNLISVPALPATTLKLSCYSYMFSSCTGLTSAPTLPATTLADSCYNNMFSYCTNLTSAPELPATTLKSNCYTSMFYGCTSLKSAPALPATTLESDCYRSMFASCTGLTSAPSLPATTLKPNCYDRMFRMCKSLTTAPELPATKLVSDCYQYMFEACSNLSYIKAMFTTTPSESYTRDWVDGVSESGTFVKNSSATWYVTGVNGVPEGWTTQRASA